MHSKPKLQLQVFRKYLVQPTQTVKRIVSVSHPASRQSLTSGFFPKYVGKDLESVQYTRSTGLFCRPHSSIELSSEVICVVAFVIAFMKKGER